MASRVLPLGTLAAFLRSALVANIVVSLLAFPVNWLLEYILYDPAVSFELVDGMLGTIWAVRLAFFAAALIALCLWTWRAWSNLHALDLPGLRFSPAYAVGAFFIPILNLLLPLRAMRELYNRSMGEDAWQADAEMSDATAWWGCTLTAAAVNLFLWFKDWFNENQLVMLVAHWAVELAMNFMAVFLIAGSAFFLFRLVGKITHAQQVLAAGGVPSAQLSLAEGIAVLESRARLAQISIWGFTIFAVAESLAEIAEATGAVDVETSSSLAVMLLMMLAYLGVLGVYIASVVFIAMWIHRGHSNLQAANIGGLSYSPGWAVGWYFIPFANLVKPFGAMRELWNASFGSDDSYTADSPSEIKLWWGCFIVGNILGNISFRLMLQADLNTTVASAVFGVLSNAMLIVCALLLAKIIRKVTAAQHDYLVAATVFA